MKKACFYAALSLAATLPSVAWAGGYGCASCAGNYAAQPSCAPACESCQPCQTVQHVHVHKSLFGHHGHHHAPMMMPMVQPMVQVPMAMAPVAQVAPVAFEAPRTLLVERAVVAPERVFRVVDAAPAVRTLDLASLRIATDDVRLRAADVNVRVNEGDSAELRSLRARVGSDLDATRALRNEVENLVGSLNQRNLALESEMDSLRADVQALDDKLERLKACIANCVQSD